MVTHSGEQFADDGLGTSGDAVELGLANSLARPDGNVTGSSFFVPELNAKRLEVLKEAVPSLSRVGVLLKRDNPKNVLVLSAMEHTAQALKAQLQSVEVRNPADLENAVSALVRAHAGEIAVQEEAMLIRPGRTDRGPGEKIPGSHDRIRRVRQSRRAAGLWRELR